ncbi:hypothetical protein ALC62_12644 [Cyphomyrmex costatus]|uniref:Regulatory protein zeste n=1 Tax=Cyphomyrmex costatus TaxID=456900 RepID=A0A151IBE8_9HYME|nr:hypothetical protein ALC62_12644 [Cyphomyrmex costatus]
MDIQRVKNFLEKEKSDLLDIIFLYRDIIENKVTDGLSNSMKDKMWATITQKFNTNKTDLRTKKYLINNDEITDWKSWDPNKSKSKISPPLKDKENISPVSTQNIRKRKKYGSDNEHMKNNLDEAKTDLTYILKTNMKEKHTYEIEILKNKLQKDKLKIELLNLLIEKEKSRKQNTKENSNIHFKL